MAVPRHTVRKWPMICIALLALVQGVSTAQTTPDQPCPIPGYPAVSCPVVTDDVIRYVISSRLAGIVANPAMPVTVTVQDGVVTLQGPVGDLIQKNLATFIARTTRGVTGVRNFLVPSGPSAMDLPLTGRIKAAINRLPFNTLRVNVTVNEGVVTLEGVVESEWASSQIEMTAEFTPGVTAVHNLMIVENSGTGFPF